VCVTASMTSPLKGLQTTVRHPRVIKTTARGREDFTTPAQLPAEPSIDPLGGPVDEAVRHRLGRMMISIVTHSSKRRDKNEKGKGASRGAYDLETLGMALSFAALRGSDVRLGGFVRPQHDRCRRRRGTALR
jgi:hypothetical protein